MYTGSTGTQALIFALGVWDKPLTFTTPQRFDVDLWRRRFGTEA